MTAASTLYTPMALEDLGERTRYEAWLLEEVYKIVDQSLRVEGVDELTYPPNGGPVRRVVSGSAHITMCDWHPKFLEAGAPLVFVTAFKLLDMLMEWVLAQNGEKPPRGFTDKIKALKKEPPRFPELIETRTWLRERLIALYEKLAPLRNTIIHAPDFKTASGVVQVSNSKNKATGTNITIAQGDLRNLARALVSLLRYLQGTWTMDLLREKRLRHTLDELVHLHGLSQLGQLLPGFLTVRLFVPDDDPIQFDIARIRHGVAEARKQQDIIFDVRIIAAARDGSGARAYLIPWDQLQDAGPQIRKTRAELATYAVQLPADVNPSAAAREMELMPWKRGLH